MPFYNNPRIANHLAQGPAHIHSIVREKSGTAADTLFTASPKQYPRMNTVPLPQPTPTNTTFQRALQDRRSPHAIQAKSLDIQTLGTLLGDSLGTKRNGWSRMYPSGGTLYPVECYVLPFSVREVPRSVCHYHSEDHVLEELWEIPIDENASCVARNFRNFLHAPLILIFTARWEVTETKYNRRAYMLALLEAGHIAQNVLLAAASQGLGARPIAGFDDAAITELCDLNPIAEQPIYVIVVGHERTERK